MLIFKQVNWSTQGVLTASSDATLPMSGEIIKFNVSKLQLWTTWKLVCSESSRKQVEG